MLSDDVFLTRFRIAVGSIEDWFATLRTVADVTVERDDYIWRATLTPHSEQACSAELSLRLDQQFDFRAGPETYEDQPIASLEMFLPMLTAIAEGRVVTREWFTAATGTKTRIETIVSLSPGSPWTAGRILAAGQFDALTYRDRRYAPYARGA